MNAPPALEELYTVPVGQCRLIFGYHPAKEAYLYVTLGVDLLRSWTTAPVKFLRFVAVYGTGNADGHLELLGDGATWRRPADPEQQNDVHGGEIWRYAQPGGDTPEVNPAFVNLEVADMRSYPSSDYEPETWEVDFRDRLMDRDGACVFTGEDPILCDAIHIMSSSLGESRMLELLATRPPEAPLSIADDLDGRRSLADALAAKALLHDDDIVTSNWINSRNNGMLMVPNLHKAFTVRMAGIVALPNLVLGKEDIAASKLPRCTTSFGPRYPSQFRYVILPLQKVPRISFLPGPMDAAFKKLRNLPNVSVLNYTFVCNLLYQYGGFDKDLLRPKPPSSAKSSRDSPSRPRPMNHPKGLVNKKRQMAGRSTLPGMAEHEHFGGAGVGEQDVDQSPDAFSSSEEEEEVLDEFPEREDPFFLEKVVGAMWASSAYERRRSELESTVQGWRDEVSSSVNEQADSDAS